MMKALFFAFSSYSMDVVKESKEKKVCSICGDESGD